jgi:hypothetical protein
MITPEQQEKAIKWLNTSITIREPKYKAAFCREIGISAPTLDKIEKDLRSGKKVQIAGVVFDELPIDEKIRVFDDLLFKLIQDPKTPSKDRELFAKRYGLLIDKSVNVEVKIGADELFRARNEARRELEAEGFSVVGGGKVRPEPPLLSKDVREGEG